MASPADCWAQGRDQARSQSVESSGLRAQAASRCRCALDERNDVCLLPLLDERVPHTHAGADLRPSRRHRRAPPPPSSSPLPPLSCSSPRFHRPPHLLLSKSSTRPPHPPPSSISLSIHASSLPPPPDTHPGPPPPPPSAATDGHRPFRPRRRRTRAEQVEGSARDILQDAEGGRCAHEA